MADEDHRAIRDHLPAAGRREIRVRRLTHEAYDQGTVLSCADVGIVTGYSPGAVSMTAIALRRRGEYLPLRGCVVDMGSFPTHKAGIVQLYLDGLTTPDIATRTYHSKEAVDRYIRGFERVRLLAAKFAHEELRLLTGMSERSSTRQAAYSRPGRGGHRLLMVVFAAAGWLPGIREHVARTSRPLTHRLRLVDAGEERKQRQVLRPQALTRQ